MMRRAAIDIGTNSVRLLVAEVDPRAPEGVVRPVDRRCSSEASFTRCASPPDSVGAG